MRAADQWPTESAALRTVRGLVRDQFEAALRGEQLEAPEKRALPDAQGDPERRCHPLGRTQGERRDKVVRIGRPGTLCSVRRFR